jgi:hypothetical protein
MAQQIHRPAFQPVGLETVISTAELLHRVSRSPDFEVENRAFVTLLTAMTQPGVSCDGVLQELAEMALELCKAHSAGVSVLEADAGSEVFRWRAVAGRWSPFLGGCMPRNSSPCGAVVSYGTHVLMKRPERHFGHTEDAPPVAEVLLVPFYVREQPVGTVWVVAHDDLRKFDREDERLMSNLARFASLGYELLGRR